MTQQTHNKSKQSLKKYLVFAIMIALFGGCMWLIFAPSGSDKDADKQETGFNSDIPDPRGAAIVGDKKTAYEQDQLRERQQEQIQSLQDYSYMMGATDENSEQYQRQLKMAPVPPDYQEQLNASNGYSGGYSSRRGNSFDASGSAHSNLTSTLGNFFEEPPQDPEKEELRTEIESLKNMVAAGQDQKSTLGEQMALMERSYQLAAKYMPSQQPAGQPAMTTGDSPATAAATVSGSQDKIEAMPVRQVQKSVVSTLCAPMSDADFIRRYSQPHNMGFNTAAGNEAIVDKNSIKACVYKTVTVQSGQEVQLRLLEAMQAGRYIIPVNTIITGTAEIKGQRVNVVIKSFQYADNIIPVELLVYDMDGNFGISVPISEEINAAKEIGANMGQSAGTTISITDNVGSQLAADLGKGVIQGASQYISKKIQTVKVTLKINHQVLLLPKKS